MHEVSIEDQKQLRTLTTLGVGTKAAHYAEVKTPEHIRDASKWAKKKNKRVVVLGGGSNVLFGDSELDALVLHVSLDDISMQESGDDVYITVGAGKSLDELIVELTKKSVWGLENLSGIPGTVGATPIQNVGAYGREVSEVIASVVVYDCANDTFLVLHNSQCHFEYRDSIFKREMLKGYIVTWVTFKLSKTAQPLLSYNDLDRYFKNKTTPTQEEVRKAVLEIRSKKFPNWKKIGTAGSFFKNPIVTKTEFAALRSRYPTLPGFDMHDGRKKIPLGYVLDKLLGLKGYTNENVGLYRDQALVLIAKKGATSKEIKRFAESIREKVEMEVGLVVEFEVTNIE